MIIIATLLFFACLSVKLALDLHQYHSRKTINHGLEAVFVFVALAGLSLWIGWRSAPMWSFGWWALFDTGYALLIGQKWYYTGTTSKLDQWQTSSPALKWLKYALVPASILFFIFKNKP